MFADGTPALDTIYHCDALPFLMALPSNYAHTIVTSPPYYMKRDYGVKGQIGLEVSPGEFVSKLVAIFCESQRVLRKDGTLWLNIGDSYANDGKWGGHSNGKQQYMGDAINGIRRRKQTGLPPKSLMGIPWRLAFALQDDGWILRSEVIWHKPNAMCESVLDRPSSSHEKIFLFARSQRYYFDMDSVRTPLKPKTRTTFGTAPVGRGDVEYSLSAGWQEHVEVRKPKLDENGDEAGASIRDVWSFTSEKNEAEHFATFPSELARRCILAGCPRDGIVLDMFMGSGTTAMVARSLDRHYIGCDLNPDYVQAANHRLRESDPFQPKTINGMKQLSLFG